MFRDRIQKQVYPHRNNTASILNYLEELVLINAKEVGLVPISEERGGYQDLEVGYNRPTSLNVPREAVSATIMIEGDASITNPTVTRTSKAEGTTTMASLVIRFKENGTAPTLNSGFGLGNNDIFELVGTENLLKFLVIGIVRNNIQVLRIQYYSTAQNIQRGRI
ncbi:hypothetical protein [Aquimarina megaterium]|uniref:hypothetical protein n=1 Tax=Aquimarina megaterium TaxID=1443666 RepID=UPI00046EA590|nr:hypothetical protein [Aquimarina megaterium]